jgi:hypothetical protein
MKRERKKRLLHELGFTAAEVQIIEELAAKRGVLAPDLGQLVLILAERYETLRKKGETTKGD